MGIWNENPLIKFTTCLKESGLKPTGSINLRLDSVRTYTYK